MVMGHNTRDARYILTGDSIADLEKGLAEMKRQIAAGITFSVCYGGDKSELEKECDNDDPNDDCNECEEDTDWDVCSVCTEENCDDCPLMDEDEEEETEIKEEVDKNKAITEMTEEIITVIKDILGM